MEPAMSADTGAGFRNSLMRAVGVDMSQFSAEELEGHIDREKLQAALAEARSR
jgi:hypothetical protein